MALVPYFHHFLKIRGVIYAGVKTNAETTNKIIIFETEKLSRG